ncbi:MAG TPA: hypothetical protein VFC85_09540 [Verrucomicrobiae bacterium]|nr:hypothetical protein [Verrucomicrobiae bacterium]
MTKKNGFMLIVLLVLASFYVFYFTDFFRPKTIHIFHTSRNTRPGSRAGRDSGETLPITFGFDRAYQFTEIKVVPLAAWQTNKDTPPIWHLISTSNSIPMRFLIYGQRIRGMIPEISGARPQSLSPGESYRLFVAAGSAKGRHDFQPVAKPAGP